MHFGSNLPNAGNEAWWLVWDIVEVLKLCRGRQSLNPWTSDSKSFLLKALIPQRRALLHRFLSLLKTKKVILKSPLLTWEHNWELVQFRLSFIAGVCITNNNSSLNCCLSVLCLFADYWWTACTFTATFSFPLLKSVIRDISPSGRECRCIVADEMLKANK